MNQYTTTGGSDVSSTGWYGTAFYGIPGLVDGSYNVIRHTVRKTIDVGGAFDTRVWGRGVNATIGYSAAAPNYGTGYCEVVSNTGTTVTLQTYVYEVRVGATYLGYFPATPSNATFAYTVLRKPVTPLNASIEGPTCVEQFSNGTWFADASGGTGGYIYEWKKDGVVVGSGVSYTRQVTGGFRLTLTVTSSSQQSSTYIDVRTGCGGGCPYVFAETEFGLEMDNNILHKSEFKENRNNDIQDLYKLNAIPAKIDSSYHLQIKELNDDHSYFDNFRFYAIDHPSDEETGVTEDNQIVSYRSAEIEPADEISFEDGEIISGSFDQVEGTKGEIMHVKFSQDKINRLKSALSKASEPGKCRIALKIGFNRFFPSLPPKEPAAFLDNDSRTLSKTNSGSIRFAKREVGSPVLVPITSDMALDDIIIHWNRDFGIGVIALVPVYDISDQKQPLELTPATHSSYGNILSRLNLVDRKYAEMDSSEFIDLTFKTLGVPPADMKRAFVLETHGRYTAPEDEINATTKEFGLTQNYPNPFNPSTTIRYTLTENTKVSLKIYNMLGQEVRTLVDKEETSGIKDVTWDGTDSFGKQVASGVYIYKLNAGKTVTSRKMIFIK